MIIDDLKTLISFKTEHQRNTPEEFQKLDQFVAERLNDLPLKQNIFSNGDYSSILWSTDDNPKLLLTAHIDVVPAADEMYQSKIEDNKLFGRGTLDMKFAIAAFIEVLHSLPELEKKSIGLLLTPDEEMGGFNGMKYVLENSDLKPECVLLPDGGANMSIEYAEKGIIHLKITAKGKAAHGSRPWLGKNAIDTLIKTYQSLSKEFPNPSEDQWITTVNIGKISGGTATNVVAEQATADIDIRVPSETERTRVKVFLKTLEETAISIENLIEGPSFELDKDNPYLISYLDIAEKISGTRPPLVPSAGSSDARFFAEKNIPVIINRPLGEGHHSDNEWIDIKSLEQYVTIILEFAKQFKI